MRRADAAFLAVLIAAFFPAAAEEEDARAAGLRAAGGLVWIADEALEGEGRMEVRVAAPLAGAFWAEAWLDARTSIAGADGLTFEVRDVRYDGGVALARDLAPGTALLAVAGLWGREAVDAQGSAQAGLAGVGLRTGLGGLRAELVLGGVVDARELSADAWARLRARYRRALRGGVRAGIDGDLRVLEGDARASDLAIGPAVEVPVGALQVRLFALYLRQRTPLGLGLEGVALGVAFADGKDGEGRAAGPGAGDVSGRVGFGLGDGRAGRLQIVAASPLWRARWRLAADVDGHVRVGEDPGDLYYLYTVGAERISGRRLAGAWFYHRSNHRPGEPGEAVTSWNVAEAGIETAGWARGATGLPAAGWGRLDGRLRLGWLLDSSFGEDRRWHVRAGARWWAPPWGRVLPFVEAEVEEGDVAVRRGSAGLALPSGLELSVDWLDDGQRFGRETSALTGTATLRF